MRIALLGNRKWVHLVKWANLFNENGHDVTVISMHGLSEKIQKGVKQRDLRIPAPFGYFLNVVELKRILSSGGFDVVNTHYATGYGTLANLAGVKRNVLSVWGSDVFAFPEKSSLHYKLVQSNLRKAAAVLSTSYFMRERVTKLLNKESMVLYTPFGVNVEKFRKVKVAGRQNKFIVGNVKKLEFTYGVDVLVQVFSKFREKVYKEGYYDGREPVLEIVGDGTQREKIMKLVNLLGIADSVSFHGFVANDSVPDYLNMFDVYVCLSRRESFGVAVLEASACELPVIASRVGGLPEVVRDGETGYLTELNDTNAVVERLVQIYKNGELGMKLGKAGRQFVQAHFTEKICYEYMIEALDAVRKADNFLQLGPRKVC